VELFSPTMPTAAVAGVVSFSEFFIFFQAPLIPAL